MFASGVMFEIGAILLAAAENYVMLILGRVFLGIAVSSWVSACQALCFLSYNTLSATKLVCMLCRHACQAVPR